ncbi:N-acetylgalactosamine kinase [Branchiostoma belcheri]|nr:N-acetylgalactosamine kinase [Branchiostoma belcheri]
MADHIIRTVQESNRPDQRTDVHPSRPSAVSRLKAVLRHKMCGPWECSLGHSRLVGPVYHSPAHGLSLAAVLMQERLVHGAGFGGCAVVLVPANKVQGFLKAVQSPFYDTSPTRSTRVAESLFATQPGDGATFFTS